MALLHHHPNPSMHPNLLRRCLPKTREIRTLSSGRQGSDYLALAEKEGFEPSRQLSHPTPLAGEPLRPLGYFSMPLHLAEREGFEPPVPFDITGFQDQRLKPLGHLSPDEIAINIIAEPFGFVNRFPRKTSPTSPQRSGGGGWFPATCRPAGYVYAFQAAAQSIRPRKSPGTPIR